MLISGLPYILPLRHGKVCAPPSVALEEGAVKLVLPHVVDVAAVLPVGPFLVSRSDGFGLEVLAIDVNDNRFVSA